MNLRTLHRRAFHSAAAVAALVGSAASVLWAGDPPKPAAPASSPSAGTIYHHAVNRIDGTPESLAAYKGKVILIVNVASQCGYTPQYAGLEKLYGEKKDKGLVILAFPANNFGAQEPGTNQEIAAFCSSSYSVTFPLFEKISVKGDDAHPLYRQLAAQPAPIGGEPKWNFTKFLIDRQGRPVARFESKVKPDDASLLGKLDELLAAAP